MADIINLQNDLTLISTALPDDLKLSDQSISRYVAAQERPGFVFLHTHIFASHIDLYRFALPSMNDKASIDLSRKLPTEFLVKAQKQAVANAISLARFCDAVLQVFDTLPKTGRLQLAADAGIGPIVTQSLRVLLIALQHNLYQDLAEHTTPPQWRSEPADEAHIRGLINSLLSITEPWCQILPTAAQAVCCLTWVLPLSDADFLLAQSQLGHGSGVQQDPEIRRSKTLFWFPGHCRGRRRHPTSRTTLYP